jgi:hypothetical protein
MPLIGPEPAPPPRLAPLQAGMAHFDAPEPDHEQAVYWFGIAADAGDAEGLAMLALCQLEGLGLPRAPVQARAGLEQAAAQGSLNGQFHLGRMLVAGWGGAPDPARGIALYTAAAAQGHAGACFNLATCLNAGWGCQPDRLAAKALFLRARALDGTLKSPRLRVRQRELNAVRELARRFERGELAQAIEERQREIALMHELLLRPRRKPRLARSGRQQPWRLARIGRFLAGLARTLRGWFGWRAPLSHDSGPTSIA